MSRTVPTTGPWDADRDVHCLEDVERAAREALPADVWDFVSGGSGGEVTLAANRAALRRIALVPRVLRDVAHCDPQTSLFGVTQAMPVAVAPSRTTSSSTRKASWRARGRPRRRECPSPPAP